MVKDIEVQESVSAGDEVELFTFSAANADGCDESLPFKVDRLVHGLQEAHNVITDALEKFFDQEHPHWQIVKAMNATGTAMRVVGAGFGAAASMSALNFAPIACSAGLGLGAAACGGIGAVFHLTAAVAGVHSEEKRHSKLRDICCKSNFEKYHEAVEYILKTIHSNLEQLRSRVELNNQSEATLLSLANPEEVTDMDQLFPSQQNAMLEEPSSMSAVGQVIHLQNLLQELQEELSRFAEMDLELLEPATSAMTEVAFHSVSMAMVFSLGTVSGASLAGMIAGAMMAAVSVADLMILVAGWHKVPGSIQALKEVRKVLGSLASAANAVKEFLHPKKNEQTTGNAQQPSAQTDCYSQQQENEEFYDCLDEEYQHCEISRQDSFETRSFCSFGELSRMPEANEVEKQYSQASVKETNDESPLIVYERSQPRDVSGNVLLQDVSGFRTEGEDYDEELDCSVTDTTGPRRLDEVSQHNCEVPKDDLVYVSFVSTSSLMSDRRKGVLHSIPSIAGTAIFCLGDPSMQFEHIINIGKTPLSECRGNTSQHTSDDSTPSEENPCLKKQDEAVTEMLTKDRGKQANMETILKNTSAKNCVSSRRSMTPSKSLIWIQLTPQKLLLMDGLPLREIQKKKNHGLDCVHCC